MSFEQGVPPSLLATQNVKDETASFIFCVKKAIHGAAKTTNRLEAQTRPPIDQPNLLRKTDRKKKTRLHGTRDPQRNDA